MSGYSLNVIFTLLSSSEKSAGAENAGYTQDHHQSWGMKELDV
jgi:hypothetical protein